MHALAADGVTVTHVRGRRGDRWPDRMSVLDEFRLDGRVVIVTGASSGLGVSFAQAFAEAGADVVLAARRVERLYATASLVEAAGRRAMAVSTDVSTPRSAQRWWTRR